MTSISTLKLQLRHTNLTPNSKQIGLHDYDLSVIMKITISMQLKIFNIGNGINNLARRKALLRAVL
jgi:hypothetical protein